jgi:integrase
MFTPTGWVVNIGVKICKTYNFKNERKMNTQIVFDHRNRTAAGKEGPVEVRITHNRKTYYIPTGVRVRRTEFAFQSIINRGDADELNRQLLTLMQKVTAVVTAMLDSGETVDAAEVKRRVWSPEQREKKEGNEVVTWMQGQMPLLRLREGTAKHYRPLFARLTTFGEISNWEDLTIENIYKFDAYLHSLRKELSDAEKKKGMKAEPLSDAGIYTYHKCFKALLNRAYKMGVIDANPYDRLKGEFSRGEKQTMDYLTAEEMAAFESIRPLKGSVMEVAHDLFIFQMYTGLAYSDTQRFDATKYKKVNGKWKYVGERVKSGVPYVSMLLPPVVEVLEKYDWHVPKMNNQRYNQMLKAIGMVIGVERLHSHMGRHTFATWMLANGAKIENVSRMMGHTNITQTQRYAKVRAKEVYDDYDKIAKKLKK